MSSPRRGSGDMGDPRSMSPRLSRQNSQNSGSYDNVGRNDRDNSSRGTSGQRSSGANEQKLQKMLNNFKREIDR